MFSKINKIKLYILREKRLARILHKIFLHNSYLDMQVVIIAKLKIEIYYLFKTTYPVFALRLQNMHSLSKD